MTGSDGVTISLGTIYEEVIATRKEVADLKNVVEALPDHERRLRFLEKAVWSSGAIGTAVGGSIVVLASKALGQ